MESLPREYSVHEDGARSGAPPECQAGRDLLGYLPAHAANDTRASQLARTIEFEIIPRLMLAHRAVTAPRLLHAVAPGHPIGADEVKQFAKLVLSQDEDAAFAAIQALRARDVSVERVYLELLAPTARYLGELWEEDLCNFTDVTVGLGRLQRVLRELSPGLGVAVDGPGPVRRVLLLPSPGEQHTFGLVMVAEFFRREGWDVAGGAWVAGADAATMVRAEWFDAIGFSLAAEVHLPALAESIKAVRHAACNPRIAVLVGGPMFGAHPEYVDQVGADGMTIDGREAPSLAESLIARRASAYGPSA